MNNHQTPPPTAMRNFDDFWTALRQILQLPPTPPAARVPAAPQALPLEEALQLSLHRIMDASRVHCDAETLGRYSGQNTYAGFIHHAAHPQLPAAVTFPNSEQEIAQLLSWANQRELRLLPWGGGTAPYHNKQRDATPFIVVDLQHLNRVLEIDTQQRLLRVQSGITWTVLEESLAQHKFTTGQCFPWNAASVGDSVATQSISAKSLRYGALPENLLAIRALCPAGPMRLRPARPGAPDERALMLGAHGAWGIITDVTLRLHPSPQEQLTLIIGCASWGAAIAALERLLSAAIQPAAARITSTRELALFSSESGPNLRQLLRALRGNTPAEVQLLLDLEGTREVVNATRHQIEELLREKNLQGEAGGRAAQLQGLDYPQRRALLRQLWERRILAHVLTAAVPWHSASAFLRDWEEALRSILLTTGGLPGQPLTTLWATQDYAVLRTLLLGHQAEGPATARMAQSQDIQAVALSTKQRWHVEEPPAPLISQAHHAVGEQLDPGGVMLR